MGRGKVTRKVSRRDKPSLDSVFAAMRNRGWEPGQMAGWEGAILGKNYEALLASGTSRKNLPFACAATELLVAHQPDTVRGNMYLLVSHGWLPDTTKKSYGRIQRLLNRLRLNKTIPFDWIVDNVRSTIKPSSWSGIADFFDTVRDAYRKDFWAQLPEYVEVIVEKDTVAGKLAVVTREFDIRLHPIRGYNSTTFAMTIARYWEQIRKPITIYYVGDHDPSGRDLERDIREKTLRFAGKPVNWKRLAVEPEHFAEFNITPVAPKKHDTRLPKFLAKWGRDCAEVEAIPATNLRQMLRAAILTHIPQDAWGRLQEIETAEKASVEKVMAHMASLNDP